MSETARWLVKSRIEVTLPDPPSANRWWRMVMVKRGGKKTSVMLLSKVAREYKKAVPAIVAQQFGGHVFRPATGPVAITVQWFRERKSGDLDKRLGVVFDALQGVLYENDSQIIEILAMRRDDADDPRVQVTVEELGTADTGENAPAGVQLSAL